MANVRRGARYRALQAWLNATTDICWICGRHVDFTVHPRHRRAPSLDHAIPLSLGGNLLDPDNARQAHYGCNSARGNRNKVRPGSAHVSYDW